MHIEERSLDDLLMKLLPKLKRSRNRIRPSKGPAREKIGVLLELTQPRARLARTEKRGRLFSALGEFFWYMSASNELSFIEHYIPGYDQFSDDNETVWGAYGPRLFNKDGINQISNVCEILRKKSHSRQAIIQLFDASDIIGSHKDVPCTCTIQFFNRNNTLFAHTHMRSNDAYLGLPHDIFTFTMLQELIARDLNIALGTYKHSVGSMHLYDKDVRSAEQVISEGWQEQMLMPPMPEGPQWNNVETVLRYEKIIRQKGRIPKDYEKLPGYWADIVRLLYIYKITGGTLFDYTHANHVISQLSQKMESPTYNEYIHGREARLAPKTMTDELPLDDPNSEKND